MKLDKVGGDRQIPAPPDGGYGWVVVSLACLNMFFVLGITYAIGTLLDTLVQSFDTTYTMMGLAFSLQIFSLHSFSPLTSAMIKRLGIRVVSFLSGTAMALGLFCCTFATSATWFCLPFGIVFGIGGSFGFMVNSVIVSQYFEKKRSTAMGIAQSGSSLGGIVWSQVLVFGTEYFDDWRIVIRILSAAVCIICVTSWFLFPLKVVATKSDPNSQADGDNKTHALPRKSLVPDRQASIASLFSSVEPDDTDVAKPFSRADILFNQSVDKLAILFEEAKGEKGEQQLNNSTDRRVSIQAMNAYRKSVCGLEEDGDNNDFRRRLSVLSSNNSSTHKAPINQKPLQSGSLLTSLKFYLFMLHGFFTFAAFMLPTQFLPSQMVSVGLSRSSASQAIGSYSIANLVGRLTSGLIMDHPKIGINRAYVAAHFLAGVVMLCFQFCRSQMQFVACMSVYGYFNAFSAVGTPSICLDLFGMDMLVTIIGFIFCARGFGCLVGPTLVGQLFDWVGSYDISNTAGCISVQLGVLCLIGATLLNKRHP